MKTYDFDLLPYQERYKLMIGAIIPRPIALITTLSAEGSLNCAPFSFFNGVCSNPPTVMVSIVQKEDGSKKDTLRNIEATGAFVINSAHQSIFDEVVQCGASYPYGQSEVSVTGLHTTPSVKVKVPRITECSIHFECELLQTVVIGEGGPGSSTVVFGKILMMHVASEVIDEKGRVKPRALQTIGRLGGISYTTLGEILEKPIPKIS